MNQKNENSKLRERIKEMMNRSKISTIINGSSGSVVNENSELLE
jgi:hypothetical protein